MDFALFAASLLFCLFGHPSSSLLLRCGLEACYFSPRAALALAAVSGLSGASAGLICRGGIRAVPKAQRLAATTAGFAGGTLGRAALLMLSARLPGSLLLSRLQAAPLFLLALAALLLPKRMHSVPWPSPVLLSVSVFCAGMDGFFGAGGMTILTLANLGGVSRGHEVSSFVLLLTLCAQAGAILLTILCQAAEAFPARMLLLLASGSAAGAVLSEIKKERGTLHRGMRTALMVYLLLAALSCIEQAL